MISSRFFKKFYPDSSKDGTSLFYNWLRTSIRPECIGLNIGAGPAPNNKKRSLKGEMQKVIGADIDNEVLNNEELDEAFIIKDDKLPFADDTFDVAWADFVFEHVLKPEVFLKEVCRALNSKEFATIFMPSVVFFVNTISPSLAAPMNF